MKRLCYTHVTFAGYVQIRLAPRIKQAQIANHIEFVASFRRGENQGDRKLIKH